MTLEASTAQACHSKPVPSSVGPAAATIENNIQDSLPAADDSSMELMPDPRVSVLEEQVQQLTNSVNQLTGTISTINNQRHQIGAQAQTMKKQFHSQGHQAQHHHACQSPQLTNSQVWSIRVKLLNFRVGEAANMRSRTRFGHWDHQPDRADAQGCLFS